jgi:phosphoribosylformimino-5-aminoimidazole carboxamide ribotide isomerase
MLEIVPSIDLRNGQVVRLAQGDYARQTTYTVDPIEVAKRYEEAGARWLHIVDLDGAKEGRPAQLSLIRKVVESTTMKVQIGGGVRETAHVEQALAECGVARVVIGTSAIERWEWFKQLAHRPDLAHRLVLAVDAKQGMVATRGWTHTTGRAAVDVARDVSDWPLGAILYTDVAKDGMLAGPNVEHTRELAKAGRVPVIASGGVGTIDHIRALVGIGVWGVIVGRSLYEGTVDLREAVTVARGSHLP